METKDGYLKDYLEYLEHIKKCSPHTLRAYRQDIRQFLDYFKDTGQEVDKHTARDFISSIFLKTRNKATLQRKIYALKSYYAYLMSHGLADKNPFEAINAPKTDKKLPEILTEKEMFAFLDTLPQETFLQMRNKALFEFFYATGLRVSEMTGLKLRDVDLDDRLLRVLGKGNKERIVPFHEDSARLIRQYLDMARRTFKKPMEHIFLSRLGKPLSVRSAEYVLRKTYRELMRSNKRVYPHLFRHSFATHLLQRGADLRVIQELLGHSNLSTTEKYTNLDYADLLKTYKKFHPRG